MRRSPSAHTLRKPKGLRMHPWPQNSSLGSWLSLVHCHLGRSFHRSLVPQLWDFAKLMILKHIFQGFPVTRHTTAVATPLASRCRGSQPAQPWREEQIDTGTRVRLANYSREHKTYSLPRPFNMQSGPQASPAKTQKVQTPALPLAFHKSAAPV